MKMILHRVEGQRGSEHEQRGTCGEDRREGDQNAYGGVTQVRELAPAAEDRAQPNLVEAGAPDLKSRSTVLINDIVDWKWMYDDISSRKLARA